MDLGAMLVATRTRIGNPPEDGFFTDEQLTDIINEALQVVSTEADWPWLQATETITTALDEPAYEVDELWVKTKQLFISGFDPLIEISLAEIDSIVWQGQPAYYAIYEEGILLGPIPGSIYDITHQFYVMEEALESEEDVPLMPAMFHYAIVTAAAAIAHRRQMRMDWADMEDKQYEKWLKRMNNYRYRDQKPIRPRIRPGSSL